MKHSVTISMYIPYAFPITILLLCGCGGAQRETTVNPTAQSLFGKSQSYILQCAGPPVKQTSHNQGTILRYYKEASMLEESRSFLKGSQPRMHHGCWASLLIENNHVTGVEFLPVPEGIQKAADECEKLFEQCLP